MPSLSVRWNTHRTAASLLNLGEKCHEDKGWRHMIGIHILIIGAMLKWHKIIQCLLFSTNLSFYISFKFKLIIRSIVATEHESNGCTINKAIYVCHWIYSVVLNLSVLSKKKNKWPWTLSQQHILLRKMSHVHCILITSHLFPHNDFDQRKPWLEETTEHSRKTSHKNVAHNCE